MNAIFNKNSSSKKYQWKNLGNISIGRPDLGDTVPVAIYRQLEFSLIEVLTRRYGSKEANDIFREAGFIAGMEFARFHLNTQASFDEYIGELYEVLYKLKIGILKLEHVDSDFKEIIVSIADDLDCSGLPPTNEMVCDYDEGFLAGVLKVYTGEDYTVTEINCWANGDRICRFRCIKDQNK